METRISQQSWRVHPENKGVGGRGEGGLDRQKAWWPDWDCQQLQEETVGWSAAPLEWCSNIWTKVLVMILRLRCYPAPALQSNPRKKKPSATFNKSPPRCMLPLHSPSISPWLSRWEWNLKGRDTVSNLLCSHPPSGPPRVLFYWHHCIETWQANLKPPPPNLLPFPSPRFLPRWCHTPYGFQQHQAGKEI